MITAHFALEGIFLWEIMKKRDKDYWLLHHPILILLLNVMAIAPDFDRAIGLHRGPVHSLLLAVAFLFITGVAYKSLKLLRVNNKFLKEIVVSEDHLRQLRFFVYAEMMWIVHIMLDLDTPLTLFWPLTDQTYQVNIFLVISVFPLLIFGIILLPYQVLGIITKVEQSTYVETLLMYISNMDVKQRTVHFGSTVGYLPIANAFFQLLVLVLWILIVGRPLLKSALNLYLNPLWGKFKKLDRIKATFQHHVQHVHWDVLLFFVLLASMGALMGTESHPTKELVKYQGTGLIISPTTFKPLLGVDYERVSQLIPPPHPDTEIHYTVTHEHPEYIACECYLFLMPTTTSQELYISLANMYYQYNISDKLEKSEFETTYFKTIQSFIDEHPEYLVKMITETEEKVEDVVFVNFSAKFVSLVLILGKWQYQGIDTSETAIIKANVSLVTTIIHHHEPIYYIGLTLQAVGMLGMAGSIIVYPLIMMMRERRKTGHQLGA